jgi:rhodanese-related sulfurtransferase
MVSTAMWTGNTSTDPMVLHPTPVEIGSLAMKHSPGFLKLVDDAKRNIRETTVSAVAKRLDQGETFHLVDTREDDEWRAGHIRGAIHLGKGVIERDIEAKIPGKNDEIILYCGGGFRSALAAEALAKMGYTNVASMDGGIREWRAAGLPEDK